MYFTARDRLILKYLMDQGGEVTVHDTAHFLGVSERTVHRDLQSLEPSLRSFGISIEKQAGKGIRMQATPEQTAMLKDRLTKGHVQDFTPEQRRSFLICRLLEASGPMKLQALASEMQVTVATVSQDVEKGLAWLESFNLSLDRRRGYGVEVQGMESDKRKAMSSLLTNHVNESDLIGYFRKNLNQNHELDNQAIADRLLGFVDVNKLSKVEEAVHLINEKLPYPIADSAYIGLIVHLALALERIIKGENIHINQDVLAELQKEKEYQMALELSQTLEEMFQTKIPVSEIGYITMHLRGAKLRHDNQVDMDEKNIDMALNVTHLIQEMDKMIGVDLQHDVSLYQGLLAHLEPVMYRIRQQMTLTNPLLDEVKANYQELFNKLTISMRKVFPDVAVPDAEIGYLVLHFGSAIERVKDEYAFRAIVICSSGIGSAKMLGTRLQREFPSITEVVNVSLFELEKMELSPLDLIFSTIPLSDMNVDYVQVNPFLTSDEVDKAKVYFRRRLSQASLPLHTNRADTHRIRKSFADVVREVSMTENRYRAVRELLENFRLFDSLDSVDMQEALSYVLGRLASGGLITDAEKAAKRLYEREKLSGVGIPGTTLALHHTRSAVVAKPLFIVIRLPSASVIQAMDGGKMDCDTVLVMLAPENREAELYEAISQISVSVIESSESSELFQTGNESEIGTFLANYLLTWARRLDDKGEDDHG
ncbi:BglG family transcription antiterminator [Salisediminibacterium halotolerans]|uniref:BglG family transcription antiterminator n=1 Tax=Salisediminibacterium halotolerans TaxID=517425 RepID=UPI000EB18A53|nr:BglG family transcription antiterminator [Salisediminibacterium halotolerans]RLJ73189.1 BglG family transcriptional antiterminator [Actinophytocola xinjiangensis]RPE86611.1 BglG family transcriptional antiterminator [Salisediminibacterium halotolerans]TWG33986.1 BglG family transcriptional antiterminator [Salisediminibacterium halotolerans]GEL06607.1 transcriptional regulator MtlR [Salisediminibacterium halotolerans]